MRDLPDDRTTPATLSLGESLTSIIDGPRDSDWVRLDLAAGQVVDISVKGGGGLLGLDDPTLTILGPRGRQLDFNDDAGGGRDSALLFVAPSDGPFYIQVDGFRASTGRYTVSVEEADLPDSVLPALDWNSAQPDSDVTFWFAPEGRRLAGYQVEGFNDYEKARFAEAFALIEEVTGLSFREVATAGEADFRLGLDLDEVGGEFFGFFNPPGEANAGAGVFDGAQWDRAAGGSLEAGGYDFVTIVHEVLHGLGLAHPHDNGGGSEIFVGVSSSGDTGLFDLNQGVFTTMSYNTGHPADSDSQGDADNQWGYEYGPMAMDIALLQQKYGANLAHATGDDVYVLPVANQPGTFWQAIWDAGGIDTIRHDGAADAVIDLRAATLRYEVGGGGFLSEVAGVAGGFTIAAGVVIENAVGGQGRDLITGNAAGNLLDGRRGADSLAGGAGNDNLTGGRGTDVLAGGADDDALAGGQGADRFVFALGDGGDVVADFGRGRDRIDLSAIAGLEFIGGDLFSGGGEGEVRFVVNDGDVVIAIDAQGDGAADLVLRLTGVTTLGQGDLLL